MSIQELDNLVKNGKLKVEPGTRVEFDGFVKSGKNRLADAQNKALSPDSRFDLAYSASHAFALAALRQKGYRSEVYCVPGTATYSGAGCRRNQGVRESS